MKEMLVSKCRQQVCIILILAAVCLLVIRLLLRSPVPVNLSSGGTETSSKSSQESESSSVTGDPAQDSIVILGVNPTEKSELVTIDAAAMAEAVKEMARFAWRNYVDNCAAKQPGGNELAPVSRSCTPVSDWLVGPRQLLTAVDALDTLALMGLHKEFKEAIQLVTGKNRAKLSGVGVSVFETCIRMLGGYLGAYTLTQDAKLLAEAVAVADSLAGAFGDPEVLSPNRLWLPAENNSLPKPTEPVAANSDEQVLAEAGTLYLEFTYLSHATGDMKYAKWAEQNQEYLMQTPSVRGLYPNVLGPMGELLPQRLYSAGAGSDSFYEYLLKKCLYSKKSDPACADAYTVALDSIMNYLTVRVGRRGLPCVVSVKYPCPKRHQTAKACKMEHLTCFLGGTYALAYLMNPQRKDWLRFAEDITSTCYLSYLHSPTGLGPEMFTLDTKTGKFVALPGQDLYILRPETIESIYYVHYVTGHKKYRHWGRRIALAINESARTSAGFSGVSNMLTNTTTLDDIQQSFFLAETLKYLYLLFQPSGRLPLDKWLFNTEAHIFPTGANPMRDKMHG